MASPFYEEGRYLCEVVAQALGQSANKGTPEIAIRFKVLEHENGDPVRAQYERTLYRYITDATIEYAVEDLKTLGYTRDSFRFIDPNQPQHHSFVGQQFIAACRYELYQGEDKEKWGVARVGSSTPLETVPLESKKLRELDNLFGRHLKSAVVASSPAPKRTAPQPAVAMAEGIEDDGMPPFGEFS